MIRILRIERPLPPLPTKPDSTWVAHTKLKAKRQQLKRDKNPTGGEGAQKGGKFIRFILSINYFT